MTAPRLVVLTPARNAGADLVGYFASVERFADAVIALDDGSTDETGEVLGAHPLVSRLLRNPPRDGYEEWDDAANRNMLLAAAAEVAPDWVLSLDVDERIDAGDAAALRSFIHHEADPSCAYLLRVFRMIGDENHYDRCGLSVGRLFAYSPGQVFPSKRLHLVPIPTTIGSDRWRETTLRIQHMAGVTAERRQARFAKYEQADPHRKYQSRYEHLLEPPGRTRRWESRPPGLGVLDSQAERRWMGSERRIGVGSLVRHGPKRVLRALAKVSSTTKRLT